MLCGATFLATPFRWSHRNERCTFCGVLRWTDLCKYFKNWFKFSLSLEVAQIFLCCPCWHVLEVILSVERDKVNLGIARSNCLFFDRAIRFVFS